MWYLVLPLLGCLIAYLYQALSRTSDGNLEDTSIDAFIIHENNGAKMSPKMPKTDKYKTGYETQGRQILVIYGTEYGFSEEVAKLLFDRILKLHIDDCESPFQPRLVNARDYHLVDFSQEQVCFIVISTSGDGVPPSAARDFYEFVLQNETELSHLEYSLLALGDSNYPQFCKTGRVLDSRLQELGCKNAIRRHDVDMEDWSVINNWLSSVLGYLETVSIETKMDYLKLSDVTEDTYNRHHPFMATLKVKKQLTICTDESDKETIHCEFDISGSDLTWISGDALGIYPRNNPQEVTRLLHAMKCGNEPAEKPAWSYTCTSDNSCEEENRQDLQSVLTCYYDLKSVKPELLCALRDNVTDQEEENEICDLLKDGVSKSNTFLHSYLWDREVADVLLDYKSHALSWKQILGSLKSLQPRYYSISSSPKVNKNTVCVTAAVLRYISHNIPRTGVTTTYLQDRLEVGEQCPVFMSCNHDFRLPSNNISPVILIGPGTGIAPFRAFIQEKAMENDPGETLLYFGCRHRNKDYLYREELEKWASEGKVTLRVAFSRDQPEKVYVQDLLYRDKQYLWQLLNEKNAFIYICGDAKHMAHDVHKTLLKIAQGEGHLSESEAVTYFKTLEQECRYQKDVWVV